MKKLTFKAFPEFVGKPMTELNEYLQKNYKDRLARMEDLTEENIPKNDNWYYAFGSLRDQDGQWRAPVVGWRGGELHRGAGWLESVWDSDGRACFFTPATDSNPPLLTK